MKKLLLLAFFVFIVSFGAYNNVKAAYPSQCTEGQSGGSQTGCIHTNDQSILDSQCTVQYSSGSCGSMNAYLNALQGTCMSKKPSGVDCPTIPQNRYYGREAAKMAQYVESNPQKEEACVEACASMNEGGSCYCSGIMNGICKSGTCSDSGNLGGGNTNPGSGDITFPTNTGLPDPSGGVVQIASNILFWILGIFGLLAVIAFIIAGIQYILSAGDEKAIDTAKASMKYAIIGVAVALSGVVIIYAIDNIFRGTPNF